MTRPRTSAFPRDRFRLFLLSAAGLLVYLGFRDYYFDDPFITYRVAENLAAGKGWVYNSGEHVNAATSPLWTLFLAGLHRLTGLALPSLAPALSILFLLLAAELLARTLDFSSRGAAIFRGAADSSRSLPALAALFVTLNPHFAMTAGMETMFLFALALAALLAYQHERWTWTGLFLGLAILARIDAALLALILALHFLATRRRLFPPGALLAFVLPLLLWFGFSFLYFGELRPGTLAVKIAQRQSSGHWGSGYIFLNHLGQILAKDFLTPDPLNLLLLALLGLGLGSLIRRRSLAGLVILAWAVGHVIAYGLILNVPAYDWYFAPIFLGLTVVSAAGAVRIVHSPARVLRSWFFITLAITIFWAAAWFGFQSRTVDQVLTPVHQSHLFFYLAMFPLGALGFARMAEKKFFRYLAFILVATAALVPRAWNGWLQARDFPPTQYRNYRLAADWITAHLPAAKSVGADEIGILGYYLPDRTIVDQCGIPTPGAAARLARGDYVWWIERYRPEALVLHPALDWWRQVEGPIKEAPWFAAAYRLRAILEADHSGPPWGKHAVEIWERVDEAAIPEVANEAVQR